jgi:hypothetical protein
MGKTTQRIGSGGIVALIAVLSLAPGCAGMRFATQPVRYDYFVEPDPGDAWSRKIEMWQARERADAGLEASRSLAPVSGNARVQPVGAGSGQLRGKYDAFRVERKRALARDLADWIQSQAREHYVADGPIDHWATLDETFETNGDDCDGLELLVYHLLLDLGFAVDEVFRAIVYRRSDGQHHMVTLWFEDPDDPWVIDPTGAMTSGMPRMSKLGNWVPLKVFTEENDYTVRPDRARTNRIARN